MKRNYDLLVFFIPIALFAILVFFLKSPGTPPFNLDQKSLPSFQTTNLLAGDQFFTDQTLSGHLSLLVVWASWCPPCRLENPTLMRIKEKYHISMYGLDLKDNPEDARRFLTEFGNPFVSIGVDPNGIIAHKLGVYGTPESFLVDSHGIIRYIHLGMMTEAIWDEEVQPLVEQYGSP
ncbi:MAG: DsbE family thiol:disulfide interchange protein [Gammaproteobacteria bacterium]|nr:DsbE family thiol:disulfide interchange protein [Gammaproteobacteria bacterium]